MFFKYLLCFTSFTYCLCSKPWVAEPKNNKTSTWWWPRHQKLLNLTAHQGSSAQIVFIGDSLTAYWGSTGRNIWHRYYETRNALNYGLSGDRTENVLYRIENGEMDGLRPKVVVIKIGTNNILFNTGAETAIGVYEVIRHFRAKLPKSRILLLGLIPCYPAVQMKVKEINEIISKFDDKNSTFYLDMTTKFQNGSGKQIPNLYVNDSIHLSTKGYMVWFTTMEPLLKKLLEMPDIV